MIPTVLAVLILGICVTEAQGQESETQSSSDEAELVPCPPGFKSVYTDPVFGRFSGVSNLTMVQDDVYHRFKTYTYEFRGKTDDGKTGVKGTHHVNAYQCFDAYVQWMLNIPAVIGTLHNAQFTSLACNDTGNPPSEGGEIATMLASCGNDEGGAGEQPGGTVRCWTLQIDHYWYYPDTGQVEYRYSETYTWCENAT
jgi:hypothetical protein